MEEDKQKIANGFIGFYSGLLSGLMYWQINIELPARLNKLIPPNGVFGGYGTIAHGRNELDEYAAAFEKMSQRFAEWAERIRRASANQPQAAWICHVCESAWPEALGYCQTCGTKRVVAEKKE